MSKAEIERIGGRYGIAGSRGDRWRRLAVTTALTTGVVAGLAGLSTAPAEAACALTDTTVNCTVDADADGYAETVTAPGEGRVVNVAVDVSASPGADAIVIELVGSGDEGDGGDIVVDHTAGTVSNMYYQGGGYRLETDGGSITVTIGADAAIATEGHGIIVSGDTIDIGVVGRIDGSYGIHVVQGGAVTIINSGGAEAGIHGSFNGITVGDVVGSGIYAESVEVVNDGGAITGIVSSGISLAGVGGAATVSNDGGTIFGTDQGVLAWSMGGDVDVSNVGGSITATTGSGDRWVTRAAIDLFGVDGAVGIINDDGTLQAYDNGIAAWVVGSFDLSNQGGTIAGRTYCADIYAVGGDRRRQPRTGADHRHRRRRDVCRHRLRCGADPQQRWTRGR